MFDALVTHAQSHPMTSDLVVQGAAPGLRSAHARFRSLAQGQFAAQELPGGMVLAVVEGHMARNCRFAADAQTQYIAPLAFSVVLAGGGEVRLRGGTHHVSRAQGEVWQMVGDMPVYETTLHAGAFRNCYLGFSNELLERWHDTLSCHGPAQRRIARVLAGREPASMQFHALPAAVAQAATALHGLYLHAGATHAMPPSLGHCLQAEGLALSLIGQWLALQDTPAPTASPRQRRAVDRAVDIIHAHFAEPLTISELARRAGTNECYLKRGFRERTGMGVAQYIRQQRMAAALAQLQEGACSVQEVAHHVGYQSLGHFARAFREHHGFLPSALQRSAQ